MTARAITYVASRWGEPTQTFVRREARGVRDLGVAIDALSLKRPIAVEDVSCGWLPPAGVARGLIKAILHRPSRSLRILASVRLARPANMPAMLAATATGLAWSGEGMVNHRMHSHFGWVSGAATRAAALHSGVPFSIVYHAFDLHTRGRLDGFAAEIARCAHQTFVIAKQDVELVETALGVTPKVLRMGVTADWLQRPADVRPGGRQIVSVGSLVPKKGHRDLIAAMSNVDPAWHLTIVGEGRLRAELQQQIASLGLTERVHLAGLLDEREVQTLMLDSDVFALACTETASGDRDGIPVALMEAMALGLPIVSTDAGAISELVRDVGFVLSQGQPEQLSQAIDQLADDAERDRFGAMGQARIKESWTVEIGAQHVAHLLDDGHGYGDEVGQPPNRSSQSRARTVS